MKIRVVVVLILMCGLAQGTCPLRIRSKNAEGVKRARARATLVALGLLKSTSFSRSMYILKVVIDKIEPIETILLFPDSITKVLKSSHLRVRGDYDKVISLVKLYTLLYQCHLPKIEINDKKVVFVTPGLAIEALLLAEKPFVTMTMELDERSRRIISVLKDEGLDSKESIIVNETRAKIATKLRKSDRWVYDQLREWCKAGYMTVTKDSSRRGSPVSFKLLYNLDFFEENNAVFFEDLDTSIKLGLDMQKEAIECLDHIVEKLTTADRPGLEVVRQSMTYRVEENTSITEQELQQEEKRQECGSSEETRPNLVLASENSTIGNRFIKGTLIDTRDLFYLKKEMPLGQKLQCAICSSNCSDSYGAYDSCSSKVLPVCDQCYNCGLEAQQNRAHRIRGK